MGGRAGERPADRALHGGIARFGCHVSQVVALDKALLTERVGKLSRQKVDLVLGRLDVVLGR